VYQFATHSTYLIETLKGIFLLSAKSNTDRTNMITGSVERKEGKQDRAEENYIKWRFISLNRSKLLRLFITDIAYVVFKIFTQL
jgi:hypothetical protein